VGVKAAGA